MLSTLHSTHQFTYFRYLFYQDESKIERHTRVEQLLQKLSRKQDEIYFNLNLHSNLNNISINNIKFFSMMRENQKTTLEEILHILKDKYKMKINLDVYLGTNFPYDPGGEK